MEREATLKSLLELRIHRHALGLSLSDTVRVLDSFGVKRAHSTIHTWVQKANRQPVAGKLPDHVAVDETVIELNIQRFWLDAADPATNGFLHVKLYPTRAIVVTKQFLTEH